MKIRLLVVDDNKSMIDMVKEYFSEHEKIEVTLEARDGEEALNKILNEEDKYDVVLLDLIMPRKDGIYVLEQLEEKHITKKIIVVTSFNADETIRRVSDYGIKYFVLKPFDLIDLEKKIIEISNQKLKTGEILNLHGKNMQIYVTKLLHELGIPSHIKGYRYIRDSIIMLYEKPEMIGGITKELYPEIARKYDTTISRVERAIRHAIEVSWNRGDWDLMEEIFGHSVDIDKAKPTNSEFVVTIADKLRLDHMKIKS